MSGFPLRAALRSLLRAPLRAIAGGYRFWHMHGARVRRARLLCACADGVRLRRPRGWELRAERLYRRAAGSVSGIDSPPVDEGERPDRDRRPDWRRAAKRALDRVREPYRACALGLLTIGAALAAGAVLVVLLVSALSPTLRARLFPRDLARRRAWTASSADPGYARSGVGPSGKGPLFFHTTSSDHPWLEIDLGSERRITAGLIETRADCCQERALPLNVEILDSQGGSPAWKLIAQRRSPFSVWGFSVEPVRARTVRVRLAGSGMLHLKRIAIYGQ